MGYVVEDTPRDGSCLYHAVASYQNRHSPEERELNGSDVRADLATFIRENSDYMLANGLSVTEQILIETAAEGYLAPEDYASTIATTSQFAGSLEVCKRNCS